MKKILVIPDSIWGSESGHRSTQFLLKELSKIDLKVAVFSSANGINQSNYNFLENNNISFFSKKPYRFFDQIFNHFALKEFKKVLKSFNPDHVMYFGAINNKVFTEYLKKIKISYSYLPLTTEYYCLKDFAGLEEGTCYKCINGNYFHALKNKCLPNKRQHITLIKKSIERIKSKKRILNADRIIAYSNSQLDVLKKYGANTKNAIKTPIFFNAEHLNEITSIKGDYFVVIGQCTTAKGWHHIPDVIRKTKNVKFKLIIYKHETADNFIKKYKIGDLVKKGAVEIVSALEKHSDVLRVIANSRAVIVPSIYPTTGEFSLLESLGLSKPVIVFDAGIHKEIFIDKHNALISRIGDTNKMSNDISQLSKDDMLWQSLSLEGKKTFDELINFKDFKKSFINIFNN